MARPLRLEFPGALYHVTSRGNGRADIFRGDDDRQAFLEVLASVCHRMNWVGYAYCLMSNHYHLVIETPDGNLSKGMRQLNGVYTQRFNRCHDHIGHVFQGRYKAILVDREAYLLELTRYVVLNPVQAGLVQAPEQWPWSSYGATSGQEAAPAWLATDWVLGQFGPIRAEAVARYVQFVHEGRRQPSIWNGLRQQIYLGDVSFVAQMQARLRDVESLDEIPHVQHRPSPPTLQAFAEAHPEKRHAMAAAYLSGGYTMKAIAT